MDVTARDADAFDGLTLVSMLIELAMPPVRHGAPRRGHIPTLLDAL